MKIVINHCHGGFGLSHEAMMRYCELKGLTVYPEKVGYLNDMQYYLYWLVPKEERFDLTKVFDRENLTDEEYEAEIQKYDNQSIDYYEIERNDPALVQVVEELGKSADGEFARLLIVEIPDDVKWTIEEYNGREWVAEVHRTWP